MLQLAILDDYLNCALDLADWSAVRRHADIRVFTEPFASHDAAMRELARYDIVCLMRDRLPFTAAMFAALPRLRLLTYTAPVNYRVDVAAATKAGVVVSNTGAPNGAAEHTEFIWALILATVRDIAANDAGMRAGRWQSAFGTALHGKTLGIIGLGNFGKRIAAIARIFGMELLAWSQNLTAAAAADHGAVRVDLDELLRRSDVVTVHLVLSDRTEGLIGAREFALMKPDASFINTSRGPIVDEDALVEALSTRRIARAGIDVFAQEPLPADHALRRLPNITLSPHMGFSTADLLRHFHRQTVEDVLAWLDGSPIRVANPDVLGFKS